MYCIPPAHAFFRIIRSARLNMLNLFLIESCVSVCLQSFVRVGIVDGADDCKYSAPGLGGPGRSAGRREGTRAAAR